MVAGVRTQLFGFLTCELVLQLHELALHLAGLKKLLAELHLLFHALLSLGLVRLSPR